MSNEQEPNRRRIKGIITNLLPKRVQDEFEGNLVRGHLSEITLVKIYQEALAPAQVQTGGGGDNGTSLPC
jgi:hypothetical protein